MRVNNISKFAAMALISCSAYAYTIELKSGWNLVGIPNKVVNDKIQLSSLGEKITDISSFMYYKGNLIGLNKNLISRDDVGIVPGQAYWMNASEDVNVTVNTLASSADNTFTPGWNFVALTEKMSLEKLKRNMELNAYKYDSISSFMYYNGNLIGLNENIINRDDVGIVPGQGYWVKAQKLLLQAQTKDGVYIKFYADESSDILDNGLNIAIEAINYSEVSNLATSNFTNFSGQIIVATADKNTGIVSELSHDIITVNASGITGTLPSETSVIDNSTTISNVIFYTYSIEEGGAPKIVSGAELVSINEVDGVETILGTSDSNGLLVPSRDVRGEKVILRSEGLADVVLSLDSTYNKPSYYAIMPSGSTEELVEQAIAVPAANPRLLNRDNAQLERAISKYKSVRNLAVYHMSQVSVQMGTKQKFTITQNSVPDATSLQAAVEESGFTPTIITALDVSIKKSTTNKTLDSSKTTFDDLYYSSAEGSYTSNIDAFYLGLSGISSDYNYGSIDAANIFNDQDNLTKGKLEVYMYKNNQWTKLSGVSELLKTSALSTSDSEENNVKKRLKKSEYYIKITDVGIDSSRAYNGYYPLAVVYKQASVTQKDFNVFVKDSSSNEPITNALVRLGATNYSTDNEGKVKLNVTVTGDAALIPLSVSEPKHLRSVTSVDPLTLTDDDSDTKTILLDAIPTSATIVGTVIDQDSKNGVSNSKVSIINPISLDKVKAGVINGVRGIEVGLDSAATYTWYIKESSDATVANGRMLARVTSNSWTKVKEGSGKEGNFLSNNEIIKTLLKPAYTGESDAISGLFDIAVKIAHDVDGDGTADYVELATNGTNLVSADDSNTTSTLSSGVASDFEKDYTKKIGQIKVALDAEKVAEASTSAQDSGEVIFVTATNKYAQDTSGESFEDVNGDTTLEGIYANYGLAIGGGGTQRAFRIDGFSTEFVGLNANLTWKVAIFADIVNSDNQVVSSVLLDENMNWKALNTDKETYEDLLPIQRGEIIADNANFVVGSLKYVEGNLVSNDSTISYKRLMRALADDKIIKALNKTIAEIGAQAGVSIAGVSDTGLKMLKDGITVSLVADIAYIREPDDANESVRAILHTTGLTLKADKVEDLLTITDAPVSPLSQIAGSMSTYSDRVGEFRFTRVPYDFAKLNDSQSLMRLGADRFDYFESNENIDAFAAAESALTTVQQNIAVKAKNTYSISLNIGTATTTIDDVVGATVVMTGKKSEQGELATYTIGNDGNLTSLGRAIPGLNGITPTFDDILEGYQSLFVYKDGYKAVKKSINLTSNQSMDIVWETVGDPADFKAEIEIDYDGSTVNYETGKAIITGFIVDKEDGSLSSDTLVSFMINNEVSNKAVSVNNEGEFVVSFDLVKGESFVNIVATNDKGVSLSSKLYYDYNPDFGSLKGSVTGLETDEYSIVSIYNADNEPVGSEVSSASGEYNFVSLATGSYKLTAVAFDLSGNEYTSNTASAKVVGGKIIEVEELKISHTSLALTGSPELAFTISNMDLTGSSDEAVTLTATVNNFELGDDVDTRFAIVVNDNLQEASKSNFTVTNTANNYTFNYSLDTKSLQSGQNVVYLVAVNKNGTYDFTADLYITTDSAVDIATKNIEFITGDQNSAISDDYVYMDIYTYAGDLKGHYLSDYNGTDNFIAVGGLEAGKYVASVYTQNDYYIGFNALVDVNASGIYTRDGELNDFDQDGQYDISLKPQSDVANVAPVLELPREIISLDTTEGQYTVYEIASDADGDDLTITIGDFNASIATADVNGYDLVITPLAVGKVSIPVTVSDGTDSVSSDVIVEVSTYVDLNYSPIIISDSSISLTTDNDMAYISVYDSDGDSLAITTSGFDTAFVSAVTNDYGEITITAIGSGSTSITVTANDGVNNDVIKTIPIVVSLDGDTPIDIINPPDAPDLNVSDSDLNNPPLPLEDDALATPPSPGE